MARIVLALFARIYSSIHTPHRAHRQDTNKLSYQQTDMSSVKNFEELNDS